MKRLALQNKILPVPRSKDQCYLYTCNPTPIHHKSNKIEHTLKIVDFYIQEGNPKQFLIEPKLGSYEPDVFYRDSKNQSISVEIQITPISLPKMQTKLNQFISEYGKTHDSTIFMICSNQSYTKLKVPPNTKVVHKPLPKDIIY